MLKSMLQNAQATTYGSDNEKAVLIQQRDEWRRKFEQTERILRNVEADLDSMVQRYGQLEFLLNPSRFNIDDLLNMSDEEIKRGGGIKFRSQTAPINVAYIVVGRSP